MTAWFTSASSKIMNGAFPPSSKESFFNVPEDCLIKTFPTGVYYSVQVEAGNTDPVNEILRTLGFSHNSLPISFVFS